MSCSAVASIGLGCGSAAGSKPIMPPAVALADWAVGGSSPVRIPAGCPEPSWRWRRCDLVNLAHSAPIPPAGAAVPGVATRPGVAATPEVAAAIPEVAVVATSRSTEVLWLELHDVLPCAGSATGRRSTSLHDQ